MKQLTLFPIRDPNTFARGIARCRAALEKSRMSLPIPQAKGFTLRP